jgi:predicted dehydrogenase
MSTQRIALVGYGAIAVHHIAAFRQLGAEIVASCNRSEARRQQALKEAGMPMVYSDPVEMVEKERPEGVVVCASVLSLFDVASRLIPLGVPLLLEKPPGTSLAEARELSRMAARHGTRVMVGLNRRFYSVYHKALAILGGREAVTAVAVEWSEDPARMLEVGHPPSVLPLLNYANSLHGIDLLTFFAGPIPSPVVWGRNLDTGASCLRWQMSLDGVSAHGVRTRFDSSWDVPGRWRLVVDAPGARFVSAPLEQVQLLQKGRPAQEIVPDAEDAVLKPGFHGQADCFLRLVAGHAPVKWPACSLEEACQSMLLAEALTNACAGACP